MDHKRTRLRSTPAAVSKEFHNVAAKSYQHFLQRGDLVEVEVEGEHNRGLPVVRGVNKRKRDPRGAGRRLQQKLESQEGSVSVFVENEHAKASSDDINNRTSGDSADTHFYSSAAALRSAVPVNTYVIIPEIMPQDQAVMKQLDKRRESSRPRVKPSKFREGILSGPLKPTRAGDPKGADDVTSSLEIVFPVDMHNTTPGAAVRVDNARASSSQTSESESSLERPSLMISGKNKFKFTYKSGAARASTAAAAAAAASASESSLSAKNGFEDYGLKAALAVVKRVMQIKSAEPFNEPVDPIALEIPDYLDVIKDPMDLGTIRELLETGKKYKTARDVYADVQLVWSNCRNYNQEGDPIMDILKIAENCFNKHWNAAGLHAFTSDTKVPKPQMQKASIEVERRDEALAAPEQREGEETKRRKSKDSKVLPKLIVSKTVHFETSSLRAKAKRSASVEHVMAESKAREDKLDVEEKEIIKEESNSAEGGSDDVGDEEESPQRFVHREVQTPKDTEETSTQRHKFEQEIGSVKDSEPEEVEVQTMVEQEVKTPAQEKDNATRGSPSNKRRTFGTMHHKPECSCVVCVGRRRKLARQEREGIEGKDTQKEKPKLHTLEGSQITKIRVSKVVKPPKAPQLQETMPLSADAVVTETMAEPVQPESQMGTAIDVDSLVDGVRYYPANYELPLRKVSPSLFKFTQILFGKQSDTVWRRHHSLGYRPPPLNSKGSMYAAVHALLLNS